MVDTQAEGLKKLRLEDVTLVYGWQPAGGGNVRDVYLAALDIVALDGRGCRSLMAVDRLNVQSLAVFPGKADAPLVIGADTAVPTAGRPGYA